MAAATEVNVEDQEFHNRVREQFARAQFAMLRWETEKTPCTGITAVSKQERRHFTRGITIAPWCGDLLRQSSADDPLQNGQVRNTGWVFDVAGKRCEVLATTDGLPPIFFVALDGRFRGKATPYDVPPEAPEYDRVATLKRDTLYFGLAVERMFADAGSSSQFVWGADWESVPALIRLRDRHLVSLTLHNTFDECFGPQASEFSEYAALRRLRPGSPQTQTALEIGLQTVDVVTTVNRGFARGMRIEPLQREIMIRDIPTRLLNRVVGVNNAAFSPLSEDLLCLKDKFEKDFSRGCAALSEIKKVARKNLLEQHGLDGGDRVMLVTMGRRSAQKQHDLLVECVREILDKDPKFPIFAVFATTHEEGGQPRLQTMQALAGNEKFKASVMCLDGRLPYYRELMAAADFNCLPSLYEPHGGAYEGTVVPIARAVDGLAEQICPFEPSEDVRSISDVWHSRGEAPTGFLFREPATCSTHTTDDLRALLSESPSPHNELFVGMKHALRVVLRRAVELCRDQKESYARLVFAALQKQEESSWLANLGGMTALIEEARVRRDLSPAALAGGALGR
jgi:glycogen synthase